jgi:hypothetical protein
MDKEFAKRLIEDLVKCQKAIDIAYETACQCPDEGKKAWLTQLIAESTGSLTEIIIDVGRLHPDLYPYTAPRKPPNS